MRIASHSPSFNSFALLTTASLSARRVPVSSGLSIGMLPCASSADGGSPPSGRRASSIFNTCVSESGLLSGGIARGAAGACIMRVSPVALASPSAASTSRTFESANTGLTLRPVARAAGGAADLAAAGGVRTGAGGGARPATGLGAEVRGTAGRATGAATVGAVAGRRGAA